MGKYVDGKTLYSIRLTKEDSNRFDMIAQAKEVSKSQAFREWLRQSARAIEARKTQPAK